jgi:hypothetical protein
VRLRNNQRAKLKAASTWGNTSCSNRSHSSGSKSLKDFPRSVKLAMGEPDEQRFYSRPSLSDEEANNLKERP